MTAVAIKSLKQNTLEKYLPTAPALFKCAWCHIKKRKMTAWRYIPTGLVIHLCFLGCQNMPEPFQAAVKGGGHWEDWERVDAYQTYTKRMPHLQKKE